LAAIVTSPLENLATPGGPLKREAPDAEEYRDLVHSGRVRLNDARNTTNSLESGFDLAYNAAHALSLAALRRVGYRAEKRYVVFQVLPHTLGLGPDVWRVLDKCHAIRNRGEYEGDLDIEEGLVRDLIEACQRVLASVEQLPGLR